MGKSKLFLIAFLVLSMFSANAQGRTSANVSIDIGINLPLPEIVVDDRKAAPQMRRTSLPIERNHICDNYCNHSLGFIEIHQHRPRDINYTYNVTDVYLNTDRNHNEHITLNLGGGEMLEVIVRRIDAKHDDYHFHQDGKHFNKNHIVAVYLNGEELPLKNGNVKLKHKPDGTVELKMDIHSIYEDHFKGKVYI